MAAKSVKLSAAERLARMSGKRQMEPTVDDVLIDLESARIKLESAQTAKPRPPQEEINAAAGYVVQWKDRYKTVSGAKFEEPPAMKKRQTEALVQLFEHMQGFRWREKRGWVGTKGKLEHFEMHPSYWHGVTCEEVQAASAVTALRLRENQLEGRLPDKLSLITTLTSLDLSSNAISGFPGTLFSKNFPALEALVLRDNEICQALPEILPKTLQRLDLSCNEFEGEIGPGLLDHCVQLKYLDLSNNKLRGGLPVEIGSLKKLRVLNLRGNALEGPIPSSFSELGALRQLDLSSNAFTGSVASVFAPPVLERCILSRNKLSGTLPPALFNSCPKLRILRLDHNQMGGQVPDSIGHANMLEELNLSANDFVGTLPECLVSLRNLRILALRSNPGLLCPVPRGLGQLDSLLELSTVNGAASQGLHASAAFSFEKFLKTRVVTPGQDMNNETAPG